MKKLSLLLFFISLTVYSQKEKSSKLGRTKLEELKMKVYEKDSTANAVVLYEHANVYLEKDRDNVYKTKTDYYFRIKILDNTAIDLGNISIDLFKKKKITDIKAVTHNIT